jgi:hypothetical protein
MKQNIIKKFTSRKLWAAIATFVASMIVAFGGDAETAETVTGLIMAGAAAVAYIFAEGLVDAAAVDAPSDKQ